MVLVHVICCSKTLAKEKTQRGLTFVVGALDVKDRRQSIEVHWKGIGCDEIQWGFVEGVKRKVVEEIGAPLFKDGGGDCWWCWDMGVAVFMVRGSGGGWGGTGGGGGVNHWEGQDLKKEEKEGTGKLGQHALEDGPYSSAIFSPGYLFGQRIFESRSLSFFSLSTF